MPGDTVVDFEEARARLRPTPSTHPALRWCAGTVYYLAHRRVDDRAACGAAGALTLAPPGVPLCVDCYRGKR